LTNKKAPVNRYDLSPWANGGMIVQNMEGDRGHGAHDVFRPHRDLHYMLVVLVDGFVTFKIDFEDVPLSSGATMLIRPGQVHQILDYNQPRGWVVEFDPLLVDNDLQFVLDNALTKTLYPTTDDPILKEISTLLAIMEGIQAHAQSKLSLYHLLMSTLSLMIDFNVHAIEPSKKNTRPYQIHQSFSELLALHYKEWKQPAHYARVLSVSVSHLNDTVKALTGISISDHIQERSVLEAKRLLFFTELSVKEIGYAVGYDDPVYFGKLFKKIAAISPLQFRSKYRD